MTSETVYLDPSTEMETDRTRLVVYEVHKGKVYNQLQPAYERSAELHASRRQTLLVTLCVLLTEMGERLTYYSLVANTILFAKSVLGFEETDAATINQVFAGVVFLVPIGGGFLADSFTGRFKTIVSSGLVYLVGILLVVFSAIDFTTWGCKNFSEAGKRGFYLSGLVLIALGTGGIKANVGPFGAEQLESLGKEAVQSFFNWFYWVINVGAFIAYAGVSYIQQEISFAWGFFVPLVAMTLSVFIFISAKSKYIQTEPKGSILSTAFSICSQGCCKQEPGPNPLLPDGSEKESLARAKISFGGSHPDHLVDGVGSVMKVIPFCLLLIIYWTVYAQMANTFFVQGTRMDIRLGDGVNVPVAALNIFNTIAIILLIPVVDRGLYPFFERIGRPLTYLKRIGIGMVLAALSLFVAGIVEIQRKEFLKEPGGMHVQELADKYYNASSMSIFVQIPQFALIGASEIFASITGLEFAYNQAPVAMQGLLTGLFLAASGFGNLLSSALLAIVEKATQDDPWWGDEINNVKMENLLFLIGGMMVVNFIVFCVVAHYYSYQDPRKFEVIEEDEEEGAGGVGNLDSETRIDDKGGRNPGEKTKIKGKGANKPYTEDTDLRAVGYDNDSYQPTGYQ